MNAIRIFEIFRRGREGERNEADRYLSDASYPLDRAELRQRLVAAVGQECAPGGALMKPGYNLSSTRAWLVYALGRVSGGDSAATRLLELHVDAAAEPDLWVRYWALAGAARSGAPALESLARKVLQDPAPQVRRVGEAILAGGGDAQSMGAIRASLEGQDYEDHCWTLRALRVVMLDDDAVVERVTDIVQKGVNSDVTYHAIRALRHLGAESRFRQDAAISLRTFVEHSRTFASRDSMRCQALIGLGKLKEEWAAPVLVGELIDYNPAVVREAARSLEVILGTRTAVARVLEEARKPNHGSAPEYARALRWMADQEAVAAELASAMTDEDPRQQDAGRALLSEIGGLAALGKLRAQSNLLLQHSEFIGDSERRMQEMFSQSIEDARSGFATSRIMDMGVFVLGIGLIVASAVLQLAAQGTLTGWVSAGTGVGGVLSVLYTLLIGKPRQRVQESVDHLMHLKIIFLGYLRQLHQADQGYIRRLVEREPVTTEELQKYAEIIEANMKAASAELSLIATVRPRYGARQAEEHPATE